MAYKINADYCTACGACEEACPNEAISEKGAAFWIDADKCKECVGSFKFPQCVKACPADACVAA